MMGMGNPKSPYYHLPLNEIVDIKRANRMAVFDAYDPALRALVHEYGMAVVKTIHDLGIRKPRQIRHVVETVLDEFSPTRGSYSKQGIRTEQDQK